MINKSKLSILIANFNHRIYIENLIKSIKQQTLQPEKIILLMMDQQIIATIYYQSILMMINF